jgi:NCS1 family nucleobase:cation symporter-1
VLAALTFAVATLGINVVANFVSPAFDFANVFPKHIDFKRGGYIAALIALVLYPFAPWEGGAAHFVNMIGNTMGPIFGVMMVDYYLIRKGRLNVDALYRENGEFRFGNGWHGNALIAAGIGISSPRSCRADHHARMVGRIWLVLRVAIAGGIYYGLRATKTGVAANPA